MTKYIRTKNGVEKMTDKEAEAYLKSQQPKKNNLEKRSEEYGSVTEQLEFISENGLEAWQEKVKLIKIKYPK